MLRSKSVYVNGEYSNEGIVRCGIPQGSILGPLLFSIFINDLPLHITSNKVNCDMFADDTSLDTSDKDTDTVQNELQTSINEASDWSDNNAMILHPAKTKVCYLLLGKNISFARFTSILKTVILNKFMSTGTLVLLLVMNLAGDHTLLAHIKQFQKFCICCHSSDTLWTLLSASCFTMFIFPLT